MFRLISSAAFVACSTVLSAQPAAPAAIDAATIMARVAANQDRSQAERAHYVYLQHARVAALSGKTLRCEETTDSRIVPTRTGSTQKLLTLNGRALIDKKYITFTRPKRQPNDDQIANDPHGSFDCELIKDIRHGLTDDRTKDGIGAGLFPLTSKTQEHSSFQLIGRERMNGRDVFHLSFIPKDKDDFGWKGDAYIDTEAYEPVVVRTAMARNLPFAVRGLLGTSLPGLGFTVIYAPQRDGLWFPVSFGTEFKLRVLFFYKRQITLTAQNRDFEKTHVDSKVIPVESAESAPPQP
jgi:hypothetical protein